MRAESESASSEAEEAHSEAEDVPSTAEELHQGAPAPAVRTVQAVGLDQALAQIGCDHSSIALLAAHSRVIASAVRDRLTTAGADFGDPVHASAAVIKWRDLLDDALQEAGLLQLAETFLGATPPPRLASGRAGTR